MTLYVVLKDKFRTGTLAEARKREFYVKPGLKRKLKSEAARKNNKGKR